jgi:hypothetical protein
MARWRRNYNMRSATPRGLGLGRTFFPVKSAAERVASKEGHYIQRAPNDHAPGAENNLREGRSQGRRTTPPPQSR